MLHNKMKEAEIEILNGHREHLGYFIIFLMIMCGVAFFCFCFYQTTEPIVYNEFGWESNNSNFFLEFCYIFIINLVVFVGIYACISYKIQKLKDS